MHRRARALLSGQANGYVSRLRGEANYRIRAPGAAVTLEHRVDLLNQSGVRVQILSVGAQQPYSTEAKEAISAATR